MCVYKYIGEYFSKFIENGIKRYSCFGRKNFEMHAYKKPPNVHGTYVL